MSTFPNAKAGGKGTTTDVIAKPDVIDSFSGDYHFLSNFSNSVVKLSALDYPTVEHAFQAAKTHDLGQREAVRAAKTPGIAKRLGRKVTLVDNWNENRISVMDGLLRQKFAIPELRTKLMATGDAILIEGNTWNDQFWGVCKGKGQNWLGKLLMIIREELRSEQQLKRMGIDGSGRGY